MAREPLPDAALLRQLLRYEPETGKLFWRERTPEMFAGKSRPAACAAHFNTLFAGKEAFTCVYQGYRSGAINGRKVRAHRVIWKMFTGEDPGDIDHVNGDRGCNQWANLRSVTRADNNLNRPIYKNNKSGVAGVNWNESWGRWMASIRLNGETRYLGGYETIQEAMAARQAAERLLGFHPNHGRKA